MDTKLNQDTGVCSDDDLPPPLSSINGNAKLDKEVPTLKSDKLPTNCASNGVEHVNDDDDCSSSDEESYVEIDEEVDGLSYCECLFCPEQDKDGSNIVSHMKQEHDLDLSVIKSRYQMDHIEFIKMINFLRSKGKELGQHVRDFPVELKEALVSDTLVQTSNPAPWSSEDWLILSQENDALLQFDFEGLETNEVGYEAVSSFEVPNPCSGDTSCNNAALVKELKSAVESMTRETKIMKNLVVRMIGEDTKTPNIKRRYQVNSVTQPITNVEEAEDSYYFESYDDIGIHAEMLKDLPRTGAYQRAICDNPVDFQGKTVMDLGCGTGILSMFCAAAGAKTVHAIDCSNIIYEAMENVFENNYGDKIRCHKGRLETMEVDIDQVDILVSEFMGYFLIYEGMLNSLIYARDKYLKPGGKMVPSTAEMLIVAISDENRYSSEIDGWEKIFGLKMTAMKTRAINEPVVQEISRDSVVSEAVVVKALNLHTCSVSDSIINNAFQIEITKDCSLTAIGGFFSVGFEDGSQHKEKLSTSPMDPPTHWKQCVFYMPKKHEVKKGEMVEVKLTCKPHHHNPRWLLIQITFKCASGGYNHSYELR